MTDFGLAVGYGVVISKETFQEMRLKIYNTFFDKNPDHCMEIMDNFDNQWSICIDSWTGEDYFLGARRWLDCEDVFVHPLDNLSIDKRRINDFINFARESGIFSIFKKDWKPELCLIHYCH